MSVRSPILSIILCAANFTAVSKANVAIDTSSLKCPNRIVIAPPPVDDWRLGSWLSNELNPALVQTAGVDCWAVIPFDESSAAFDIVGSTTAFPLLPGSLKSRQIRYLVETLNASHIAFPEKPAKSGRMRAKIFSINQTRNLVYLRSIYVKIDRDEVSKYQSSQATRFLSGIAPNSVQLGYTNTNVYFDTDENFIERKIVERSVMPAIVSSIGVTRVEHPRAYGLFDVAGTVFPGQYFFGIDQDNTYKLNPEAAEDKEFPQDLSLHIKTYGACGSANAQASFFTPLGTTYIGAGWGPCLMWLRTQSRAPAWYGKTAVRLFFGHRMFATDNLYFSLDWGSLLFNQRLYKSEFARASQIERAGFSMGWYVENTEKLASEFWHWLL